MSYRNDHDAAVARIDALERENAQLKNSLEATKKTKEEEPPVRCPRCNGPFWRFGWAAFGLATGAILASGLIWLVYTAITEHGPSHCYVEGEGYAFHLRRTVEWGDDLTIGNYRTMQEALDDAARIKCEVK